MAAIGADNQTPPPTQMAAREERGEMGDEREERGERREKGEERGERDEIGGPAATIGWGAEAARL